MERASDFYDDPQFSYINYWAERGYEEQAEKIALKRLLETVPSRKRSKLIDIGGGYGRFCSLYTQYFEKCFLLDPSSKLIKKAKKKQKFENLTFTKGQAENIPYEDDFFDVALLIRVAHHLQNFSVAVEEIGRVLKKGGYFILEFPNKAHLKGRILSLLGMRDVFFDLSPVDRRTKKEIEIGFPPFYNYHPYWIVKTLENKGWKEIERLSVSNFRHSIFKRFLSDKLLLYLEKRVQKPFAKLNLGPSIFLLLKKLD